MTGSNIARLLVAGAMMLGATPATAQSKYYMRERIVGMPVANATPPAATTYVPGYSQSYGPCTNGTQSRQITSCSTSDGQATALSNCSSFPQSKGSQACSATCGTMVQRNFGPAGGGEYNLGPATSASDARSLCTTRSTSVGMGACGWNSSQKIAYFWQGVSAVDRGSTNTDHLWGATCQ
jgi:hypothetical protein